MKLTRILFALAALLASAQTHAQALLMDSGRLQKQLETRRLEQPLPSTTSESGEPTNRGAAFGQSEVRVAVKKFRVTGATLVPEEVLQKALAPFTLRILNFTQLQQAADALTQVYRERGFITSRAFLPQQTLSPKSELSEIEIVVLEGRYGRIRLENASQVPDKLILDRLGLKPGEPVVLKKIERNLLLVEDLPGVHVVSSVFIPGDQLGESEYILAAGSEPRASGTVSADNYGVRPTGNNRVGFELILQNPSGNADQINANAATSGKDLTTGRLAYSLPLGNSGLRGSVSIARTSYRLGEELSLLDATGTADYQSVGATYPLVRERSLNVAMGAGLDFKRLNDKLNGAVVRMHTRLVKLSLSGDEIGRMTANGASAWSVSVSQGTLDIDDESARVIEDQAPQIRGNFTRTNLYLLHEQALSEPKTGVSLQLSLRSQFASKTLDASEKMPLGGPNGVRSLPQGEVAGDRATLASVELKKRTGWVNGWSLVNSVFYDAGHAILNAKPWNSQENKRTARAYGLGLSLDNSGRYFVNSSIAWASGQGSTDPAEQGRNARIWVQLGSNY